MKRSRLTACVACLVAFCYISANNTTFIPKSPTEGMSPAAMAFHRYGDVPVSLYTGTPSVNIPLAELKEGHLMLPINLSYHSAGVKINEHPGWTGMGWTLTAGGAITREIRDVPDEIPRQGYRDLAKQLNLDNATPDQAVALVYNVTNGGYMSPAGDTEPDKFNFQLPGYSGYFMLNSKCEWQIYCDRPIKVSAEIDSSPSISFPNGSKTRTRQWPIYCKFVLTGDDGTTYTFGNDAVELTVNTKSQTNDEWFATAWYLTEIRSIYGDVITFNYERGDFIVNFSEGHHEVKVPGTNYGVMINQSSGNLISPVYLTDIQSSTFGVKFKSSGSTELDFTAEQYFERSPTIPSADKTSYFCPKGGVGKMQDEVHWRQLDEIRFTSYENIQFRRVAFNYSSDTEQRLTLNKVCIYGFDNEDADNYTFSYNDVKKLPPYLSTNTDHWGFFGSKSTSPDDTEYKQSCPPAVPFGTIREIIYPTGGRTLLEFEPHTYTHIVGLENEIITLDSTAVAGGYRICRTINIPADSTIPEIKEYEYPDGLLEGKPLHSHNTSYTLNGKAYNIYENYSIPLSAKFYSFGNHICYPTVIQHNSDGSYVTTTFMSAKDVDYTNGLPMAASDFHSFGIRSMKSQYRGKPKSIVTVASDGRTIIRTDMAYDIVGDSIKYCAGLSADWFEIPHMYNTSEAPILIPKYSLYRNFTHSLLESSRTVTTYNRTGSKSSVSVLYKRYNQSAQLLADSLAVRYADGRCESNVTRYEYQWQEDNRFKTSNIMHLLSRIKHQQNAKTVREIQNQYSFHSSGFPMLTNVLETYGANILHILYECSLYDSHGLPVHTVDENRLHHVYLWGHDRLMPVAEIVTGDVTAVQGILGFALEEVSDDENIRDIVASIRQQYENVHITSYEYTPFLGVTTVTRPSGRLESYDYDWRARLIGVRNHEGSRILHYIYNTFSKDYYDIVSDRP